LLYNLLSDVARSCFFKCQDAAVRGVKLVQGNKTVATSSPHLPERGHLYLVVAVHTLLGKSLKTHRLELQVRIWVLYLLCHQTERTSWARQVDERKFLKGDHLIICFNS